jgi:HSP20 family molecular chaperone IbpA
VIVKIILTINKIIMFGKFKDGLDLKNAFNDLKDKAKEMFKEADAVITEELKDNPYAEKAKEKISLVTEKVQDAIKKFRTEEIDADDKNDHLLIQLVLAGLDKTDIDIEHDETNQKILITINAKKVDKTVRECWNVDKTNLYYNYSAFGESVVIDSLTSTFVNGVLTIKIPKAVKPITEKKKFIIN